jgi:diguanylate cyclase (GGDEF)-like protein
MSALTVAVMLAVQLFIGNADATLITAAIFASNVVLLYAVDDAFFDWEAVAWWSGLLALEASVLVGCAKWVPASIESVTHMQLVQGLHISVLQLFVIVMCLAALMAFTVNAGAVAAGMFWASIAFAASMYSATRSEAFAGLAAMVIGISAIERSHWIAYHDELTGLPGRRAFNEAVAALGEQFSIAVVDVDHFKRFNDTYGHDTGDQVLRKVAGQLAQMRRGRAFRCGGEEFAVVFPEMSAREAKDFAEILRQSIEADEFIVRGPDRSSRERPDRRVKENRKRREPEAVQTNVTVSIGVAEAFGKLRPAKVMAAADKALYRAKANGRNRVEIAIRPMRMESLLPEVEEENAASR